MPRRNENTELPRENLLKIDKDCHVDPQLEREYIQNSIAILRKRKVRTSLIQATRTRHGRHYYIHIDPSVEAQNANQLQYLLGDDPKRVGYNQARINSGLQEWNKLFEVAGRRLRNIYLHPSCGRNKPMQRKGVMR